jgi:hypothetical protein
MRGQRLVRRLQRSHDIEVVSNADQADVVLKGTAQAADKARRQKQRNCDGRATSLDVEFGSEKLFQP